MGKEHGGSEFASQQVMRSFGCGFSVLFPKASLQVIDLKISPDCLLLFFQMHLSLCIWVGEIDRGGEVRAQYR